MQAIKNTIWNLLIVVLCGVLVFLLYKRGKLDQYLPEEYVSTTFLLPGPLFSFNIAPKPAEAGKQAESAPAAPQTPATASAPANRTVAAPVERVETSRPAATAPAPAAAAAPAAPRPATQAILLSALAPRHLPREVKLLKATTFPVMFNGRAAGTFSAPAGLAVKLVRINQDKLTVQSGEAVQEIPATDTDIYQRVEALMNR